MKKIGMSLMLALALLLTACGGQSAGLYDAEKNILYFCELDT